MPNDHAPSLVVRVARAAVWLPEGRVTGAAIAAESGLPAAVVTEKMGIVEKRRARPDEHPSMMAIEAARLALEGVDPLSIDVVIWTGSEHKDHIVWTAAIHVQRELGLKNAWAFDASARCSTGILGMQLARGLMAADPRVKRVLLAGGHRTGDLVNTKDPDTRFLYNLADGGSALLLERGDESSANPVGGISIVTDGAFSQDVVLPAGGTRVPVRPGLLGDGPTRAQTFLTVPDPAGMKQRLDAVSLQNFLRVIRESAGETPINFLALLHMKRSAHDAILQELGLAQSQSIYLDRFGHFGSPDQVLSLGLAEQQGTLKPGDHVVFASAGLGYMWAAAAFRWDAATFGPAARAALR